MTMAWPAGSLRAQEAPTSRERMLAAPPQGTAKDSAPPQALAHYERGRQEYLAGRYREALEELRAALELDPSSPNLVYNVARVYEDLGELDQAIAYYRRYGVLLQPDAVEERDKTAKTIRRLEGARDELENARLEQQRREAPVIAAAARPEPASAGGGRADVVFWLVASTGVVLAAGGGVTGWFALRREKQVSDFVLGRDGSFEQRETLRRQANQFALASDVLSISAGAAILSAALLFLARDSTPSTATPHARLSVAPHGHGARLEWQGRF